MKTSDPDSNDPLDHFFAEARAFPPDTAPTEFALETRVLALVRERREQSRSWGGLSWKLVPFCASIVLVAAFWAQQSLQAVDDAERLVFDPDSKIVSLWTGI